MLKKFRFKSVINKPETKIREANSTEQKEKRRQQQQGISNSRDANNSRNPVTPVRPSIGRN
jgi:hypothetical protein